MAAVLRGPSNLSIARLPCSSLLLISLKKVTRNLSVLPAYEKPLEATDDLVEEHIFTQQHMEMRHAFRKLIEKDINPYVDQWEKEECIPTHKLFKKLGDAGFLGVNKPVEYGGLGLDYTYAIAVQEELAPLSMACIRALTFPVIHWGDSLASDEFDAEGRSIRGGSVPMAVGVQTDVCSPALANFGSHELKEQFLRPSVAGDIVGCLGVNEVDAGSDVASIKTKAVEQGDDYIINGGKMWTTNGCTADWMCILANTSEGNPHRNKSLIIVPMDTPGISVMKIPDKLGMRSSDTAQTFFDNVRVPQKFRICEEGLGFIYQMLQFQDERLLLGVGTLLPMERLINETAKYCGQRKIFGKPVLDNQVVHFKLAELQTEVEMLRSLIYRAAGLRARGIDVTRLASMIKLKSGRLLRQVADSCLQFWGGMGYTDNEVSRAFRDNRLMSIGGGADEVMLSIICKFMGTFPKGRK